MTSLERIAGTSAEPESDRDLAPGARAADARMDILAALDTLPPIHREVIVLREMQGLSYKEIAGVLRVPRGTVESRLFRARRELKERLKDYLP
jgi:RNA polymerase sigma-70 factor (ECF subfamily)